MKIIEYSDESSNDNWWNNEAVNKDEGGKGLLGNDSVVNLIASSGGERERECDRDGMNIENDRESCGSSGTLSARKRTIEDAAAGEASGKKKMHAASTSKVGKAKDNGGADASQAARPDTSFNKNSSDKGEDARVVYKYNSKDKGPYVVYVYGSANKDNKMPHPLTIAKLVTNLVGNEVMEIKSIGRGKVLVHTRTAAGANSLISLQLLKDKGYRAFVPTHLVSRAGVIGDIPEEFDDEFLKANMRSACKIVEARRIKRRVASEGEVEYVPTRSVRMVFEGRSLPSHVVLFSTRIQVSPFVPNTNVCFNCFRVGHIGRSCKGSGRCLHCGKNKHDNSVACDGKNSPTPRCINCGGQHLATSFSCPEVVMHRSAVTLAATENISISDARNRLKANSGASGSSTRSGLRFDYGNFPLLGGRMHSSSTSSPGSEGNIGNHSPYSSVNRFEVLNQGGQHFEEGGFRSYAQSVAAAAGESGSGNRSRRIRLVNTDVQEMDESSEHSGTLRGGNTTCRTATQGSPWPTAHQAEFIYPNGRDGSSRGNGVAYRHEHSYAKNKGECGSSKDLGKELLGFFMVEVLPRLAKGELSGAISILCSFVIKLFAGGGSGAGYDEGFQSQSFHDVGYPEVGAQVGKSTC